MSKTQKYIVILILLVFWMAVVLAPIFAKGFQPPPEVNAAIPALIGTVLAVPTKGVARRNGQRDSSGDPGVSEGDEEGE